MSFEPGRRRWLWPQSEPGAADALARALGVPPLVASILLRRGLERPDAARAFLESDLSGLPDPARLADAERAAARLVTALCDDEPIAIYGDYDVDGVTSAAVLWLFVREAVGRSLDVYIPHRMREGYGLNAAAINRLADAGTRVLVTVDNGSASIEEAALARRRGMDLIIVDHHQVSDPEPEAFAHLNPHRVCCQFPDPDLAAVGVTFLLVVELRRQLRAAGVFAGRADPRIDRLLDLVALGTVADVAPLQGLNRALVRHGLEVIHRGPRTGMRALLDVAGVEPAAVTARDLGFRLGPRINAAGRIDDAMDGFRLLTGDDVAEARRMGACVERQNRERRALQTAITDEAMARVQADEALSGAPALVLADAGWHPGVIGIVASRLVERFHRPAILLAADGDGYTGSARSVPDLDIKAALDACAGHLDRHGGHPAAAGLRLQADRLSAFTADFCAEVSRRRLVPGEPPPYTVDAEVDLDRLREHEVEALARLGPFGHGNPAPLLAARSVRGQTRPIRGGHLKLALDAADGACEAIGWNMEPAGPLLNEPVDLLFSPAFETWRGRRRMVLRLRDLRPATGLA